MFRQPWSAQTCSKDTVYRQYLLSVQGKSVRKFEFENMHNVYSIMIDVSVPPFPKKALNFVV